VSFAYIAHSARVISAYNFSLLNSQNLNQISHQSAVNLIQNALAHKIDVSEVYVDTVGPKEVYRDYLQKLFPEIKVFVEEKADSLFKIVGAASIVAKVNRDLLLEGHVFDEAEMLKPVTGFGSGYVDEDTMNYMNEAFDPVFGYKRITIVLICFTF
jgi:ribonuclease H2 subunit A